MNTDLILQSLAAASGLILLVQSYRTVIYPLFLDPLRLLPGAKFNFWTFQGTFKERLLQNRFDPHVDYQKQFGGIFHITGLWNSRFVMAGSSSALKKIFSSNASNYPKDNETLDFFKKTFGEGLLAVQGEQHRRQRAVLNPAFRSKNIDAMVPTFIQCADDLRDSWLDRFQDSKEIIVNLDVEMTKPTLDAIGRAGFGYEFNASKGEENKLFKAYATLMESMGSWAQLPLPVLMVYPVLKYVLPSFWKEMIAVRQSLKTISETCKEILEQRKQILDEDGTDNSTTDLLSATLRANRDAEAKNKLTDTEVMGQIMTFLVAGHETTSVALTWTLHLLTQYPDIQTRLRKELQAEAAASGSATPSDAFILSSTTYLEAVTKESLRYYPPVPVISRMPVKADDLDGYKIPKGVDILMSPFVIHRNTEYWGDDAEEFNPERWLKPEVERPYGAFFTFALGSSNCIGQRFAVVELKAILTVLLLNFEFAELPDAKPFKRSFGITWKPTPSLHLAVKRVVFA